MIFKIDLSNMANNMFDITSRTLKSALSDFPVDFPRYQRNKAWDGEDRFKLCISVFKRYPIGSIVVKNIGEEGDVNRRWILDGRQRYETLIEMQNPESIYKWAKMFCILTDSMSKEEVKKELYDRIDEYLGYDVEEDSDSGIRDLAEIVCNVHPMKKKRGANVYSSGFRTPFLFEKFKAKYSDTKRADVNPEALLDWILGSKLTMNNIPELSVENIYDAYDNANEELRAAISRNFESIKTSLKMVKIIQHVMTQNELSLITLNKECKSSDEMKIFEIINTGGQRLSNAQVRSAKEQWNRPVENILASDNISDYTKKLYKAYELTAADEFVTWDFAATFTDRLTETSDAILGNKFRTMDYTNTSSKDKLEFGFKLLSARFMSSVTKEKIDELPNKIGADWSEKCTSFAEEIENLSQILTRKDGVFMNLQHYGLSLFDIGQNMALCYLILAITRWEHYDHATSGQKYTSFIYDMRMLLDSFIYEYITEMWRGSGDSHLSENLNADFETICKKIDENVWNDMIDKVYSTNEFPSGKRQIEKLKVLTYYFTALRDKKIIAYNEPVHVDHIIPKSQFPDNTDQDHLKFKDSLYNYALLPPEINKEKSDWVTSLSPSNIKTICELEDLDEERLNEIITAANMPTLKEMRSIIPDEVKKMRKQYVDCSDYWTIRN